MGDEAPRFEERDYERRTIGPRSLPTAGAIPVLDEKTGKVTMQKVKVQRYIAGKAPAFAEDYNSDDDEDDEEQERHDNRESRETVKKEHSSDRDRRHRRHNDRDVAAPEILDERALDEDVKQEESEALDDDYDERRERARLRRMELEQANQSDDDDDGDGAEHEAAAEEDMERRRRILKMKALKKEEEFLIKQEEVEQQDGDAEDEEEEESSEEEEEEDDPIVRLKPVFVKKKDRVTLQEAEAEAERERQRQLEEEKRAEQRKRESAQLVKEVLKHEEEMETRKKEDTLDLSTINTDDESEEIAYEEWKLREMKRIKRNREERDAMRKEQEEIAKVHAMTEEERKAYLKANPKLVTNQQEKGKMKFLQKYFHRGVFFLDKEHDILKRDFNEATGDDSFNKEIVPKVMQVKNFGKSSRSKWTHLTAEDTTEHGGTWATTMQAHAGAKQNFERPTAKKRKIDWATPGGSGTA